MYTMVTIKLSYKIIHNSYAKKNYSFEFHCQYEAKSTIQNGLGWYG